MLNILKKLHITFILYRSCCKSEWNKIKENFRKCKQRTERMSRSEAGNKKLPECKLLHE